MKFVPALVGLGFKTHYMTEAQEARSRSPRFAHYARTLCNKPPSHTFPSLVNGELAPGSDAVCKRCATAKARIQATVKP